MGEHQNPLASIKRVNSSKHMQYEQVLHNLGKKMFYRAPISNALFEEPAASQAAVAKKQAPLQNTASGALAKGSAATSGALHKKFRQTDSNLGGNGG